MIQPVIAIHGGAGAISRAEMSAAKEREYLDALRAVLERGQAVLAGGGSALDAVTEAVRMLEDCPLFNAGHGAVFTSAGTHELDACIMDGATLRCGAIANVTRVRNPVLAARKVMENSQHVFFVGQGAEAFAREQGLELVDPSYFSTEARLAQLRRVQSEMPGAAVLDHDGRAMVAGCYASNRTCAVSTTGTGEMFIRTVAAYDVAAQMAYAGATLAQAADGVVHDKLPRIGGKGGLIAVDARGNVALPFNTEGMYRGYARVGEAPVPAIYR